MKKNFVYAMMSAIALTGAVSLTSCSSSEEINEDVNPTFDGNSVRTDFAFNITKASQATTRTTAAFAQANNETFLGMTHMYLIPFDGVPGADGTVNSLNRTSASSTISNYPLGSLIGLNETTNSSKVYSLAMPVGTDNFLFYAKADHSAGDNYQMGRLGSSFFTSSGANIDNAKNIYSINDIHFDLVSINTDLGGDATKIASYLTAIANTTDWAGTVTTATTDGTYSALSQLYQKFTSSYNARSGSAESVVRMVLDLYKSAYAINHESSVAGVKTIATAICKKIETAVNGVKVVIKADNTDNAALISIDNYNPDAPDANTADSWVATASEFSSTFPANSDLHYLPMGSAQLLWDGTKFVYNDSPYYTVGTVEANTSLSQYCYPSEILYFDNSPLRATDTYQNAADYPTSVSGWDTKYQEPTETSVWKDFEVKATTRAVAMTNNVNYGVAMLKTDVHLASAAMTDNMAGIIGGSATAQTITAAATRDDTNNTSVFKVTGILIGGQPDNVGWNMVEQSPAESGAFSNVIYDKEITFAAEPLSTTKMSATGKPGYNYTIVLDNYNSNKADNAQDNVMIALQIVNDGVDFYGANGLIPSGSTFYLAGTLDFAHLSTGSTWTSATRESTYRITKENVQRVFRQDYMTTADITISADALSKAYSTIPDLRSTEVLFGLSVDLTWETGLSFDITM